MAMMKRLQVLLREQEYKEIQRTARARHLTMAEWVRQALIKARREEPSGKVEDKLALIRAMARCEYPTADIGQMLAEIERGYAENESAV